MIDRKKGKNILNIFILISILFILFSIITNSFQLNMQKNYAEIINIAGRQRMLSQRIEIDFINILNDNNKEYQELKMIEIKINIDEIYNNSNKIKEFIASRNTFSSKLSYFFINKTRDDNIALLNQEINNIIINYRYLSLQNINEKYSMYNQISENILNKSDKIVLNIQNESKLLSDLIWKMYLIFNFFTISLLFTIFIIFNSKLVRKILLRKIDILDHLLLKNIFNGITDYAIYFVDKDGYIKIWNKGAEKINGFKAGEVIGKHISLFDTVDLNFSKNLNELLESVNKEEKFEGKIQRTHKNGSKFWAYLYVSKIIDFNKNLIGYSFLMKNIEKEIEIENQVKKLLEYQKTLLDNANLFIISTDINGIIISYNSYAQKMLQYDTSEIIDIATPTIFIDKEKLIEKRRELLNIEGTENFSDFEVLITRIKKYEDSNWIFTSKNGNKLSVRVTVSSLTNNDNQIYAYLFIAQNNDQLNKYFELENMYRKALDLSAIVAITDQRGIVTYVNKQFCDISEYSSNELIGKTHKVVNSNHHPSEFFRKLWKTISSGEIWHDIICNKKKNGDLYWVNTTIIPFFNKYNRIEQYISIRFDITKQKNAEKELVIAREAAIKAVEAKARFLAHMSHEIRTPLNGLIGMSELLGKTVLNDKQRGYFNKIESSGELLLNIVNDILDLSKLESDNVSIENIHFSINEVIEKIINTLGNRAEKKNLNLSYFIDPNIPEFIIGDPLFISQVLLNLVSNSIKFTESGSVKCNVIFEKQETLKIRIEVIDTGIGLSEDEIKKLFKPFVQADISTTRKYGGTGLGLSICKLIISKMGGEIGVKSTKNQGCCFWFTIPQEMPLNKNATEKSINNAEIFIISDDNEFINEILIYFKNWKINANVIDLNNLVDKNRFIEFKNLVFILSFKDFFKFQDFFNKIKNYESNFIIKVIVYYFEESKIEITNFSGRYIALKKPIQQSVLLENIFSLKSYEEKNDSDSNILESLNILIAEDNEVNQELIMTYLSELKQNCKLVSNGLEALNEFQKNSFDLIFMDCQMPIMDGFSAVKEIRKLEKQEKGHIIIIALTANATKDDYNNAIQNGMDDFLTKPLKSKQLIKMLNKWQYKALENRKKIIE